MSLIYEALPRLEDLYWEIDNPRRPFYNLRYSLRESLASTLLEANFSHLVNLKILYFDRDPLNENWKPENHVGVDGKDHLSLAVKRILKLPKLVNLDLDGAFILSPTIFDQDGEHGNISESLKNVRLYFSKVTPTRSWYFTGSHATEGQDVDERDFKVLNIFRYRPAPTTFNPLLVAMARGITKMPALECLFCCFHDTASIACYIPDRLVPIKSFASLTEWRLRWNEPENIRGWILPSEFRNIVKTNGHQVIIQD